MEDGSISAIDTVIVVAYLLGIMAVGILAGYKKNTSSDQFFLAGRSLRWPLIGTGLFCANISTIHLVGLASSGYKDGLVIGNFEWMAAFCLILLGMFFAPFYFRSKISTLPEYVEKRYGTGARTFLALIFVMSALLVHIGISLYAGAKVLEEFFGIPYVVSIIVISVITAIYTILGGLKAVMITDAIQAVLLLLGAAILTSAGILALPGVGIESWADFKAACRPRSTQHDPADQGRRRTGQPGPSRVLLVLDPLRVSGSRYLVLVYRPDDRAEDPGRQDGKRRS